MADDRTTPIEVSRLSADPGSAAEEFTQLRELLVGPERGRLDALGRRLDELALDPEELADHLPEAIARRAGRDRQLARALAPTVESAISESVRRNPREIATAIFPVLGPAIRKAIAQTMAGLVQSINSAIEHSLSIHGIRWRLEAWRTGVPYAQIVIRRALVYRVEQAFLIHADTGLLLSHVAAPDLKVPDADLVSGMLTAIQDFVSDSFQQGEEGGKLRTFSVGELSVIVEQGPQAMIAAVVRGQAPDDLVVRLQDTLETLHLQMAGPLADFVGDTAPFEAAHPLLEEVLHTVLTTDRARPERRGARRWLLWLVPVAALLLLAWLRYRAERHWDQAVARLRAEPGLVLVEAERDGGRWRFEGLRDPLASDPATVLAGLGVDSAQVEARWMPYLSLEPPLIVARARRDLGVPETVAIELRDDSLVLTGTAPLDWVGRTGRLGPGSAGVRTLDLSGVGITLPEDLAALQVAVDSTRVLFEVGSAALDGSARRTIAAAAATLQQLREGVEPHGWGVRLELVGRTDPTGSDSTNQSLSRIRADAVASRLAALGYSGATDAIGVGTTRPLPAPDGLEGARVNRSVSFAVRFERMDRNP